jgi:hypothetical protein
MNSYSGVLGGGGTSGWSGTQDAYSFLGGNRGNCFPVATAPGN